MKHNSLIKNLFSLFILTLIVVLFASCTSCGSAANSSTIEILPDPSVPDASTNVVDAGTDGSAVDPNAKETVKGDTWSLQVPSNGYKTLYPQSDILLTVVVEQPVQYSIALGRELASTQDEYLIYSIRSLRDSQAQIIGSSTVTLNGNKFSLLEVSKDNVTIWAWLLVKNNMGYTLSCGGPSYDDLLKDSCQDVANSLQIN